MSDALSAKVGLGSLFAAMLPPEPPVIVEVADPAVLVAEAYRDGLDAGEAAAEARLQPTREVLTAAAAAFEAAMLVEPDALRNVFVTLVTTLAETVIAAELRLDPVVMVRLVDTALAAVVTREDVVVRVHPDDAGLLDLAVVADASLTRGTVVVDEPAFVIRDGLDLRLAALIEGLA